MELVMLHGGAFREGWRMTVWSLNVWRPASLIAQCAARVKSMDAGGLRPAMMRAGLQWRLSQAVARAQACKGVCPYFFGLL